MQILICDDAAELPAGLNEYIRRVLSLAGIEEPKPKQLYVTCVTAKPPAKTISAPSSEDGGTAPLPPCDCGPLDLGDQPEQAAAILDALGIALLNRGCFDEGKRLIEAALKIRRDLFGDQHPCTAASLNSYARVLRSEGDLRSAELTIDSAIRINRRVFGGSSLPVAINLLELATIQLYQGQFEAADSAAARGLKILRALRLEATDPNTARLLDIRGRALQALRKLPAAIKIFDTALALDAKQVGKLHPKYATHLCNSATVLEAQGKLAEAEKRYRYALNVYLNVIKRPKHPNLIDIYANLGSLLAKRGTSAYKEADQLLNDALNLNKVVRGPDHILVGNDHVNLGRLYFRMSVQGIDRIGDAGVAFDTALEIYAKNVAQRELAKKHPFIAEALTWKALVWLERKVPEPKQAERFLRTALNGWGSEFGKDSLERAVTSAALGRSLVLQSKEPGEAAQLLKRNYPIIARELGPDSDLARLVQRWIAELASGGGKAAKALPRRRK